MTSPKPLPAPQSMSKPRGITVLIDANVLIRDPRLESTSSSILLSNSALGTIAVAIPEVALHEALHDFCEQAKKAHSEIQRQLKTLMRLGLEAEIRTKPVDELCSAYERDLKRWLTKNQIRILDYPTTGHREIARMAIEKRRPFDERGRGYRDTLIWRSLVELVATSDVWFVSNDNGFRAQESDQLAPALVDDIKAAGHDVTEVRLFRSLTDCVAELGKSIVQPKIDIGERLKNDPAYRDALLISIEAELLYRLIDAAELPHPMSVAEQGSIDSVQDLEQIYVADARQLKSDELFVQIEAFVQVELELLIAKSEIASIESDLGHTLRVDQWDFNPRYLSAFASARLNVSMSALADAQTLDLKRVDVDEYTVVDGTR